MVPPRPRVLCAYTLAAAGRKLVQVGLTCRDLDTARSFYRDKLGLPLMFEAGSMLFFQMEGLRLMVGLSEKPDRPIGGTYIYFDAPDVEAHVSAVVRRFLAAWTSAPASGTG